MIDEIDSFLRDRDSARHSWEITSVNEMLTRMEGFSGIFIASINLMDGINPAALQRFDMKIKFSYPAPEQAALMLTRQCALFGLAAPTPTKSDQVRRIAVRTPGDFAALGRRHRFDPFPSCASVVDGLMRECALGRDNRM